MQYVVLCSLTDKEHRLNLDRGVNMKLPDEKCFKLHCSIDFIVASIFPPENG